MYLDLPSPRSTRLHGRAMLKPEFLEHSAKLKRTPSMRQSKVGGICSGVESPEMPMHEFVRLAHAFLIADHKRRIHSDQAVLCRVFANPRKNVREFDPTFGRTQVHLACDKIQHA